MNVLQSIKGLALFATLTSGGVLGHQITTSTIRPATVVFTVLAAVLVGLALGDEIRQGLRTVRRHLSRKPGPRFRCTHGDPADWDDDEYEAYFAITIQQNTRTNIRPAA
ncbi:hypothetical protein GCM10018777_56400 [Streptomyces albogriseolus]|uniref:hypothetical protein n=1 Tax=Streptomyces TaxID=1883 RepID=UPI00167BFAEE|nr:MULTISPECIES: hypothetical protein [Streptomyces]GHB16667.1 hypothetical protein GCM10010330_81540 [Streptomyces tendae]GHG33094.1 hypothetical protein GCM10018777_56400 [Streptomyces viridodiastaticus]